MNPLETYLKRATQGLWGRKRREVIEELRGSIEARVWALEHQGHHADTALEMALRELGDARAIRQGLWTTHALPLLTRNITLSVIAGLMLVTASVQQSLAQIAATTRQPVPACQDASRNSFSVGSVAFSCDSGSYWITLQNLREVLEPKGVKVQATQARTIELTFPGAWPVYIKPEAERSLFLEFNQERIRFPYLPDVVSAEALVRAFQPVGVPTTLTGWNNPTLMVGKINVQLGTQDAPIRGEEFYRDALVGPLETVFTRGYRADQDDLVLLRSDDWFPKVPHVSTTIQVDLPNETIVAFGFRVVTSSQKRDTVRLRYVQVGVVQNGRVQIQAPLEQVKWVSDQNAVVAPAKGATSTAVMWRFTGRLDAASPAFQVIAPNRIRVLR